QLHRRDEALVTLRAVRADVERLAGRPTPFWADTLPGHRARGRIAYKLAVTYRQQTPPPVECLELLRAACDHLTVVFRARPGEDQLRREVVLALERAPFDILDRHRPAEALPFLHQGRTLLEGPSNDRGADDLDRRSRAFQLHGIPTKRLREN